MWEYWDFEFRRVVLRPGWQDYEADYDLYLADDVRLVTVNEARFHAALIDWIPNAERLQHSTESSCPL